MALCACGCGQDAGVYTRTRPILGYCAGDSRQYVPTHASRVSKAGNPALTAQLRQLRETEGLAAVAAWCSARLEKESGPPDVPDEELWRRFSRLLSDRELALRLARSA